MTALDLVEDSLAVWRLTHLVVEDVFPPVEKARNRIKIRFGVDHPAAYLVSCMACSGIWVALVAAIARRAAPGLWRPAARLLATAAAAPLVEAALNRLEAP